MRALPSVQTPGTSTDRVTLAWRPHTFSRCRRAHGSAEFTVWCRERSRSICMQCGGMCVVPPQELHDEVRRAAVQQLTAHPKLYRDFVHGMSYEAYVSSMATPGSWGDNVSLQVTASFSLPSPLTLFPTPPIQQPHTPSAGRTHHLRLACDARAGVWSALCQPAGAVFLSIFTNTHKSPTNPSTAPHGACTHPRPRRWRTVCGQEQSFDARSTRGEL